MRIITRIGTFFRKLLPWRIAQNFTFMEKVAVLTLSLVGVCALGFWAYVGFVMVTVEGPKNGGVYTEAVFGQPTYYNPILLRMGAEGEAEANITTLVYSGLFRADGNGGIVPDLAQEYDVSEDGKTYTIKLRQNALWHDGERVTADDVVYTFHTIQDKRFTIPASLAHTWSDISIEKVDDFTVKFSLKKPFVPFIAAQLRIGILPEHIWGSIEPDAFALAKVNTQPIGSGPYKFQENITDENGVIVSTTLSKFRDYYDGAPYINRIKFSFMTTEEEVVSAYQTHQVMGMSIAPDEKDTLNESDNDYVIHKLTIPSTYGVFFNPLKSAALAYGNVRTALAMATDRQAIVDTVLKGEGQILTEPFVDGMTWKSNAGAWPQYNIDAAIALLEKDGWKAGDDGIRAREGIVLRFSLVVPEWDGIVATADIIKEQWRRVGADVQVKVLKSDAFRKALSDRSYGALLFGQTYFSFDADPFAFWHSSQKSAPGLNFSQLTNKDIDKILTRAQSEHDEDKRKELYKEFNEKLAKNAPAVFLYTPHYLFVQSKKVRGVAAQKVNRPAERFATITQWYVLTKRTFKKSE